MEDKALEAVLKVLLDNKGEDIVYLNVSNFNPLCEYYVIATVESNRQALALARYCEDALESNNEHVKHIEGNNTSEWILVDGGNYIIHLFVKDARRRYGLEKMWSGIDMYKVG